MISFDLSKEEFKELISELKSPALVQLLAKIDSACTPLQLYRVLQASGKSGYSYLLESVEKQETHARYSFVGTDPDAVLSIKDRKLTLSCPESSGPSSSCYFHHVLPEIKKVCRVEREEKGVLFASIREGFDVFDALRSAFPTANGTQIINAKSFDRQTFFGGAIGYTAYDAVYDCWSGLEKRFESEVPDMLFALVSKTCVFDHLRGDLYVVLTPFVTPGSDPETSYEEALFEAEKLASLLKEAEIDTEKAEFFEEDIAPKVLVPRSDEGRKDFEASVLSAKEHILEGDIFQVVLSRKYVSPMQYSPFEYYKRLRAINPSPYMYIFQFRDLSIVGASPEALMKVHGRMLYTNPIAGTCPRGKSEEEDEVLASRLLADEKERAEHVMLVDLARNDVRMVSESDSVKVSNFMRVLKYSHVQHIESEVFGKLRPECDQFDASRAVFPAGTLSGAPKLRAMEIIAELERDLRGVYGGGVGYYAWNGDSDFAIAIRTLVLRDGWVYVQAGAGIVADSVPSYEFEETEKKMAAMRKAAGDNV